MCGLVGFVDDRGSDADTLRARATAMADVLRHRGPDGSGVFADPASGVGLAHRRLAIIDLSDNGAQPMTSADGRYVMVFNGEIFNHLDLAARLRASGRPLRGHSDTEVLLETIAEVGLRAALERSNGQFAVAVLDRREQTISLARDRIGEKPLYYTPSDRLFSFASELSALRRDERLTLDIDPAAVSAFVRHTFVPAPLTIYRQVRKLEPGHLVTYDLDARRCGTPEAYWSLTDVALRGQREPLALDDDELLDRAHEVLQESVRMRMLADVPVGAFLSAGVDSSLVVSLMRSATTRTVRTFTVSVGGEYDETRAAAAIAAHLGTEHTEISLSESEALDLATQVPTMFDEPFADPSAIPVTLMSRAARREVTVCVSGDGGDELLAGYNRYLAATGGAAGLRRMPAGVRRTLSGALESVPPARLDLANRLLPRERRLPDLGTKLHKLAVMLRADAGHRAGFDALATNPGLAPMLRHDVDQLDPWQGVPADPSLDVLHEMMLRDGTVTLPDDMLVKVDRASMSQSLEVRVPLLDHRFVELAWSLPTHVKTRQGEQKWLLRRLLDRHVPPALRDTTKRGFDPPLSRWLRGPLRSWADDMLSEEVLTRQGILDPVAVRRLLRRHQEERCNADYRLWTLLVLTAWVEHQSTGDTTCTHEGAAAVSG